MIRLQKRGSLAFSIENRFIQHFLSFKQLPLQLGDLLVFVITDILHLVQLVFVDSVGDQSRVTVHLAILDFLPHLRDFGFPESNFLLQLIEVTGSLPYNLSVLDVLLLKFFLKVSIDVVSFDGFVVSLSQLVVEVLDLVRL